MASHLEKRKFQMCCEPRIFEDLARPYENSCFPLKHYTEINVGALLLKDKLNPLTMSGIGFPYILVHSHH